MAAARAAEAGAESAPLAREALLPHTTPEPNAVRRDVARGGARGLLTKKRVLLSNESASCCQQDSPSSQVW